MKAKKILIMITHSLGEVDVVLPLVSALRKVCLIDVEMIFTVEKIFNQFNTNKFYMFCIKNLGCKVTCMVLPNKFDLKFRGYMDSAVGFGYLRALYWLFYLRNLPFLINKLVRADIYMHEHSNQYRSTRPLYWANKLLGRMIYVYQNAHSIRINLKIESKVLCADKVTLLSFHDYNRDVSDKMGFVNQYKIGFPKFYREWMDLVRNYKGCEFEGEQIALIYTTSVRSHYIDEQTYAKLIESSCNVIRGRIKDLTIVIKPHPREDTKLLRQIIDNGGVDKVFVSWENAAVLAKSAIFAITFGSSAILDSLSLRVPSVEYFIESDASRESYPHGSAYKQLGVHSVDNEQGLGAFIDTVIDDKYEIPSIVHEIADYKDLGFMDSVK